MHSGRGGKREGSGRKGTGRATKVLRVPLGITSEEVATIPSLKNIFDYWGDECAKNPGNPRHHFLQQMLDEIKALGY